MQTRPDCIRCLRILNLHLLRPLLQVEPKQKMRDVRRRLLDLRVVEEEVENRAPNRPSQRRRVLLIHVVGVASSRRPLGALQLRLGHVLVQSLHERFLDAERLRRRLKKAYEAIELDAPRSRSTPLQLGELLLDVEEGRVGDDGEDLNGKERDLVVFLAGDEEGDLDDDLGMVEERLVERVEGLEARELLLRDVDGALGEGGEGDLEEGSLEVEGAADDAEAAEHAAREERRAGEVVANRIVSGGDDGEDELEKGSAVENAGEDIETGVEDELGEGRGLLTTSAGGPREEGSEVERGERLLDERERDVRDLPPLLGVGELPRARLEENVVDDELDVRVDTRSAVRRSEVVGDGVGVELDASADRFSGRRGVDEGIEELNEGGRLGVDLIGRLDLLQFGEDPALERERLGTSHQRAADGAGSEPSSTSSVPPFRRCPRRQDLTLLQGRPRPPRNVDAEGSTRTREGFDGVEQARLQLDGNGTTGEGEEGGDGTVALVVVEGGAGDVRVGDDLAKEANEGAEEGNFFRRHLAHDALGVRTGFERSIGEVGEVKLEGTEKGGPRAVGGGTLVGVDGKELEGVGRAERSRGESGNHLVVRSHHRGRTALAAPAEEGGEAGVGRVGRGGGGRRVGRRLLPELEAAVRVGAVDGGDEEKEGFEVVPRGCGLLLETARRAESAAAMRSRDDVLFAIAELAEDRDPVRDNLYDEDLHLLDDVVLEPRVDQRVSSQRLHLPSKSAPDLVELLIPLERENRLPEEGEDSRVHCGPRQAIDELPSVLFEVGHDASGRVEEDGPKELDHGFELGNGPGTGEVGAHLGDERLVLEERGHLLGGGRVGGVEGGEEGDEDVDGGAVGEGGGLELLDEEVDVVLGHVSTGADEEKELTN